MGGSRAGSSQRGVPAEDDLQLSAVQLPSVRQGHDAPLVPQKSFCVHGVDVLPETTREHKVSGYKVLYGWYSTVQRHLKQLLYIWQVEK